VAGQIALALVLGTGAALMVHSLINRERVDLGYDPAGAVRATVALSFDRYDTPDAIRAGATAIIERLQRNPDVAAAGVITWALPTGAGAQRQFTLPDESDRTLPGSVIEAVSPGYFAALGVPLKGGRDFAASDGPSTASVAVVNEELARRLWPGRNPVGQRLKLGDAGENAPVVTVVGVVGSIRRSGMHDRMPARVYLPFVQYPNASLTLVVRARHDTGAVARALQSAVRGADPMLFAEDVRTIEADVAQFVAPIRMITLLLSGFGIGGLLLAGLGVFGTMSYTVSQRGREIAIRAALGATRRDILGLVLRKALKMTFAGVLVGTLAAAAMANALRSFLFGVTPADPWTFAGITLALVVLAIVAAYRPARSAASIDPMAVLRQ
jgi:predicted permease